MAQSTKPGKLKGRVKAKEEVSTSINEITRTSLFLKNDFMRNEFSDRNALFLLSIY
jgi:hypothetical protein